MKEKIEKLNEAMKVLKEECAGHKTCLECPLMIRQFALVKCRLGSEPECYKLFEEDEE